MLLDDEADVMAVVVVVDVAAAAPSGPSVVPADDDEG
jgi:hypothetical protein